LSETQRRDARAGGGVGAASVADREAKIEQLLLIGLDHYFAAQYEQAINVWTRALFFDRNHARARAYIERARSALAERQRQSEELLHKGVAAFHRGDGDEARRLLQAAIEAGAPTDEALAVLERLNRSVPSDPLTPDEAAPLSRRRAHQLGGDGAVDRSRAGFGLTLSAVLVIAIIALGGYIVSASRPDWQLLLPFLSIADEPASGVTGAPVAQDLTLPLPRRGEMALVRAHDLVAAGRLHDAIAVLEQVRSTDPQREEADRLRGEIQRHLLALTPMPATPAPPPERRQP
jgi:tetratricopeptide (TPR) repeat protein